MAKIAIVDDSTDALELFEAILRNHHEFLTFADPEEFLRTFRPGEYGLVLLDIAMPNFDGFDVFRQIRERDKDVPVAALTAIAPEEGRDKAMRAGFCDYFTKPVLDIVGFRKEVYSHVEECSTLPYNPEKSAA